MRPAGTRALLVVLPALLAVVSAAHAGSGVNLRWDRCLGDAGVFNKNFACNTNSGSEVPHPCVSSPLSIVPLMASFERFQMCTLPMPGFTLMLSPGQVTSSVM